MKVIFGFKMPAVKMSDASKSFLFAKDCLLTLVKSRLALGKPALIIFEISRGSG